MSKRKADEGREKSTQSLQVLARTWHQLDLRSWGVIHIKEIGEGIDWIRISYRDANITWNNTKTNEEFSIKTPVPCGMTGLIVKLQTQSGRSWETLLVSVKTYFDLKEKSSFDSKDFKVEVSIAGMRIKLCQYFFS